MCSKRIRRTAWKSAGLSLLLLLTSAYSLADGNWRPADPKIRDGVSIYTKKIEGSSVRAFKGVVELETSLASVLALFNDVLATTEWLYGCVEAEDNETISFLDRYVYHVIDLPGTFFHRDYVLHVTMTTLVNQNGIELRLVSMPEKTPKSKHVRVQVNEGFYRAEKTANGNLQLTWEQHVEPGGLLPGGVINMLLTDIPFDSLKNFRQRVKEEKYQNAELVFDDVGNIIGLK